MSNSGTSDTSKMKGMLTDVTKCIGCEKCVEACARKNKLPRDFLAHFTAKDGLSANRFTSIVKIPDEQSNTWRMVRRHCMHCLDPSCQAACLVGAFAKTPDGAVTYDASKCIGCRYCMLACPFSIPRYEYHKKLPYIRKCKMNEECRVKGGQPACVSACPTEATIFGNRDDLIKEAKRRINSLPEIYENHIYGEREFGGTSVMYLSDIPIGSAIKMPTDEEFKKLRVPRLANESIPSLVEPWVWVTPFQFLVVSSGLAGTWFLRRRSIMMNSRKSKENDDQGWPPSSQDATKKQAGEDDHEK